MDLLLVSLQNGARVFLPKRLLVICCYKSYNPRGQAVKPRIRCSNEVGGAYFGLDTSTGKSANHGQHLRCPNCGCRQLFQNHNKLHDDDGHVGTMHEGDQNRGPPKAFERLFGSGPHSPGPAAPTASPLRSVASALPGAFAEGNKGHVPILKPPKSPSEKQSVCF